MLYLPRNPQFVQKQIEYYKMRSMVIPHCRFRFSVVPQRRKVILQDTICINSLLLVKNYGEVAGVLGKVELARCL